MGATLTEQRRVSEEGFRIVKLCCMEKTTRLGNEFSVMVPYQKAPANYVPAAAVIRRGRALSGFTGCKGSVDGYGKSEVKGMGSTCGLLWKLPG